MPQRFDRDDDEHLTLRAPRSAVAVVAALIAHVVIAWCVSLLPNPKKEPERIQIALTQRPMSPPPSSPLPSAPTAPPVPSKKKPRAKAQEPPPVTSPVLPELPPSEEPPENRAQLPVAERSPDPAPPPTTWKERLLAQLASTRPRPPKLATGPLAPSPSALDRVAMSDARMHDEEMEHRMAEDFGPFFRRGLEALRARWHPDEVLDTTEHDPTKRCGRQTRTTFAVAVLDKSGGVVDVELKNPSGCPELDDEAVAAFKRVAQFPHPPAGIFIGPDGAEMQTARYPVRFIVTFDGGLRLDYWH